MVDNALPSCGKPWLHCSYPALPDTWHACREREGEGEKHGVKSSDFYCNLVGFFYPANPPCLFCLNDWFDRESVRARNWDTLTCRENEASPLVFASFRCEVFCSTL